MALVYKWLIPLIWVLWFAYWMEAARRTGQNKRAEHPASRLVHVALTVLAFALVGLPGLRIGPLGLPFLISGKAPFFAGVIILASGLAFAVWARRHLGRYWSGTVTLKDSHRLIRTGPYAIVRHPIYTGITTGMIGTAVALGEVRGLVAVAVLLAAYLRKIRIEETWLTAEFGDEYRVYRREVKALIPWVL
jgi:protein-S-isoprenylcysteine O-methyltransferase Ste14